MQLEAEEEGMAAADAAGECLPLLDLFRAVRR